MNDANYLKDTVPGVDIAVAFEQRITPPAQPDYISYQNERVERMIIRGTPPDYAAAIALFTVATGRFISEFDESRARPVVVIGNAIADSLFPNADPIDRIGLLGVRWRRDVSERGAVFWLLPGKPCGESGSYSVFEIRMTGP